MTLGRLLRPSLPDIVFVILVLLISLGLPERLLNSDGDLGRHLRVGEAMIEQRELPTVDRFSYTMEGQPFIPFEWLSEVAVALAYRGAGMPGVVVFSAAVFALTLAVTAGFMLRRATDPLLSYAVAMVAAVLAAMHLVARPHLFTMLGAAVVIRLVDRSRPGPLWHFALLFVIWANLHGGFLFGLVIIAIYAAGEALELLAAPGPRAEASRLRRHLAALLVSIGACLLNPVGVRLFTHVFGYLGETYLVDATHEYQSPDFHTTNGRVLLAVIGGIVVVLAHAGRRPTYPRLLLLLATLAFALHSMRNIPLFALTALPVLAIEYTPEWRRWRWPRLVRAREAFAADMADRSSGAWSAVALAIVGALAVSGGRLGGIQLMPTGLSPARFPVEAVAKARAAGLEGRIFSELTWGGYLLHAWPEQKVFIDAQTDFYGTGLTQTYERIYALRPGWRAAIQDYGISLMVLPSGSALAEELRSSPEWTLWHVDRTASVLRRRQLR